METEHASIPLPGLPEGAVCRSLEVRDLDVHILEAGRRDAPLILLLHGFPELAFSWRNVIVPLANLGYHVVAPDTRGYGRTKPRDPPARRPVEYEDDLRPYRQLNLVHDIVALVFALGHTSVAALIGHDFGSTLTGNCAFVRPDLFRAVVFMSAPYTGSLVLPFASDPALHTATTADPNSAKGKAQAQAPVSPAALVAYASAMLAKLEPPRKHYMQYFCGPNANTDILRAPQGLHAFLRGYFHAKSGDWVGNDPHPIGPTPDAIAQLPHYYIMPAEASMADVARAHAPTAEEEVEQVAGGCGPRGICWGVRADGVPGGLNRYRGLVAREEFAEELSVFSGRKIEVPAMYLAGEKDWGIYQFPGALDKLRKEVCTRMDGEDVVLLKGAGHWVQQEKAEEVVKQIKRFLEKYN